MYKEASISNNRSSSILKIGMIKNIKTIIFCILALSTILLFGCDTGKPTVLDAPTDLRIDEYGETLMWTAVKGATEYGVICGEKEYTTYTNSFDIFEIAVKPDEKYSFSVFASSNLDPSTASETSETIEYSFETTPIEYFSFRVSGDSCYVSAPTDKALLK